MKTIKNKIYKLFIVITIILIPAGLMSQTPDQIFKAAGTPGNPKVNISWNRYYTYDGIIEICKKIQNAYPDLFVFDYWDNRLPKHRW